MVNTGWGLDMLPLTMLVILMLLVTSRLLAGVGVCGSDDETVDFERVRVFGAGGGNTKVVPLGEFDLNM